MYVCYDENEPENVIESCKNRLYEYYEFEDIEDTPDSLCNTIQDLTVIPLSSVMDLVAKLNLEIEARYLS